jgi:hypothetical protein
VFRFQSGFFFRHPLLDQYDYYWRVEPDVDYYCDVDYDVFKFMRDNNKKYGNIHINLMNEYYTNNNQALQLHLENT